MNSDWKSPDHTCYGLAESTGKLLALGRPVSFGGAFVHLHNKALGFQA